MKNDHTLFVESLCKAAKGYQRGTVLGRRFREAGEPSDTPESRAAVRAQLLGQPPIDDPEAFLNRPDVDERLARRFGSAPIKKAGADPMELLGPAMGQDAIQAKLARRFGGSQPVEIQQQVQQIDDQIENLLAKKKSLLGGVNSMGEIERSNG